MSFPKYPKYKDSGVEWLGEIPEHWKVSSVRHCLQDIFNGLTADQIERGENTVPVTRIETISSGIIDFEKAGYIRFADARPDRLLLVGDVLFSNINSLNMIGNCARYCGGDLLYAGMNLLVLRPNPEVNSSWFFWLIKSGTFRQQVESLAKPAINQASISQTSLRGISVAIPLVNEQANISEFLNRETSKIDALIEEQQRLIELLKEKRQAVISQAVIKGLNPDVPMKDSGVEWLGEIPAHWTVCTVRRLIKRIEQGWSPECVARPAESGEWGVVKSGCVNRGIFDDQQNKALPDTLRPISEYEIRAGDVLMSRASGSPELIGSTALVSETRPYLMLSDKVFRIHLGQRMSKEYFVMLFNSRLIRLQIERAISGAEGLANNLPQAAIRTFSCAVPPLSEQGEITNYIFSQCWLLDELIQQDLKIIDVLRERRISLISEAVTGKIDVRNYGKKGAA